MHATSSQSFIPQTKIKLILTEKHLKDETVNANERGFLAANQSEPRFKERKEMGKGTRKPS